MSNVIALQDHRQKMETAASDCPEWCEGPAGAADHHIHASAPQVLRDIDPDDDLLSAFTVRCIQTPLGGSRFVDLRVWHAGDPGQTAFAVETLLTADEARELAQMLVESADHATTRTG